MVSKPCAEDLASCLVCRALRLWGLMARYGRAQSGGFRRALNLVCLAVLLAFDRGLAADPTPLAEHQIKALYLYNLTKYMEWPADAFASTNAPFTIGLMAGTDLRGDLLEITKGKVIGGREILVRFIERTQDVKSCQLIFLESGDRRNLALALNAAKDLPVLPVGVSEDFINSGGIIIFSRKDNKLKLRIDLNAARRARLTVSAKLMAVAENASEQPERNRN
jgi:YfiR/HmsC-like